MDFQKDQLQSNEQIADWEIGLGHHQDDDFKIKKQIENELDKEIGFSTENERRDDKEKHLIDSANIDFRKKFYNSKSKLDEEIFHSKSKLDEEIYGLQLKDEKEDIFRDKHDIIERHFLDKENDKARDDILRMEKKTKSKELSFKTV